MPSPKTLRIFSGMRPTGMLHIGHLAGALDNWVRLQNEGHENFHMVADWHALTSDYADTGALRDNVIDMVMDWLAVGLDPERTVIFRQSHVPEHAELYLLLNMITPIGWLERNPTYKEQVEELRKSGKDLRMAGFFTYPVLQTADIILYKATAVPVGGDQAAHVELAREIVRRFNHLFGDVFPEPQTLHTDTTVVPGLDGRKMSKSYGNAILLQDTPEETAKKLKPMITDPARKRRTDPGDPAKCRVFDLHQVYSGDEDRAWVTAGCTSAAIGCIDCKAKLAENMNGLLAPLRERRRELAAHPDRVRDILEAGSARARQVAQTTMAEVREAMKI